VNPKAGSLRRLAPALGSLIATTCLAGEPLDIVRDCAATASPTLQGLKDLGAVCPELRAALDQLGLDRILYEGWEDKLNVHALHDLIELNQRYSAARWHGAPDSSAVPGILKSLNAQPPPQVLSWWRAFESWIGEWLDQSNSSIAKWLKHLLDGVLGANVSPGAVQAFVYIVTILTTLAAGVIIVRELKAAGIAARFRRRRPVNSPGGPALHSSADDEPADETSPAGMLRALVKRLLQTGRLTAERSLTHRELIGHTRFENEAQRAAFAGVARTAESVLYGAQTPAPEIQEAVTRQGRELLRQLSARAATP
jgi:hypothetical protein